MIQVWKCKECGWEWVTLTKDEQEEQCPECGSFNVEEDLH